jgi:hypothetical protein
VHHRTAQGFCVDSIDGERIFIAIGGQTWLIGIMRNGSLTGLEILVVDDEPLLRRQIAVELENFGGEAFYLVWAKPTFW